jgi:acyl-CoA thioester hydrolase
VTDKRIPTRREYAHLKPSPTRWGDNDAYGHVNNVVYYAFFDSEVNRHLIEHGVLDIQKSPVIGFVIETRCTFFKALGFPDIVHVGMKVVHLGRSSVRYDIALFRNDEDTAAAAGEFVHVYVDRNTGRPTDIPGAVRDVLRELATKDHHDTTDTRTNQGATSWR